MESEEKHFLVNGDKDGKVSPFWPVSVLILE